MNDTTESDAALAWLNRLEAAVTAHDIEALVGCFGDDYVNETPAHPDRGFTGQEQVRRNWTTIFQNISDLRARVPYRCVADDGSLWTEWEMSGTRPDGGPHEMRGVVIFGISDGQARWARFYLEPVEAAATNADTFVQEVTSGRST